MVVCQQINIKQITRKFKLASIATCLLLGVLWPVLPLFGWSFYTLEGGLTTCAVEWAERSIAVVSYNATIFIFVFFVPLFIITFTNIKLIYFVSDTTFIKIGDNIFNMFSKHLDQKSADFEQCEESGKKTQTRKEVDCADHFLHWYYAKFFIMFK